MPISVSKINVRNSKASYEELSLNEETPGEIYFTDINAEIDGLANIVNGKNQLYTIKG
ncbi:MAG: hypothetical protein LBG19_12320 [Prevotellaceae bacterium]|jgi:hypothetical protein|nr:hypothetical protein [Prevotellaceae bacterium]